MPEFKDTSMKQTKCPSCGTERWIPTDATLTTCNKCGWAYKTKEN